MVTLLFLALFRPDLIQSAIQTTGIWSQSIGHWNALLIFFVSSIESFPAIGVLVPGQQVLLVIGGFYWKEQCIFSVLSAALGASVGNWLGYIIGVRYGKYYLSKYGHIFSLGITEQKILKPKIEKNGAWFIILGKFHNFTRAFVPFLAGTFQMTGKNFWKYNIIGSFLWAFIMVILGVFFTTYYETILKYVNFVFLGWLILFWLYIYFYKRKDFEQYIQDKLKELESNR
jgi:membrane protein DedA with SNARE-associated domain